jgi:hypothetical protein
MSHSYLIKNKKKGEASPLLSLKLKRSSYRA